MDVVPKERRRLVLRGQGDPLHLGHLRAMINVTEMGGIMMRALDLFDLVIPDMPRWGTDPARAET